ncbi:MAG: Rdx family protein [Phycisphaerales bacterium]|nr:Rdx family protein [Phycisphaerales bacterium]
MPKAASLADAIEAEFDTTPELISGGGGVFDVVVDGRRIFSKHETGRFPEHHEIIHAIDQLASK